MEQTELQHQMCYGNNRTATFVLEGEIELLHMKSKGTHRTVTVQIIRFTSLMKL